MPDVADAGFAHPDTDRASWLAAAFGDSPLATALVGADLRLAWTNRTLARVLGRPGDDLAGLPLADLAHPTERDRVLAHARHLIDGTDPMIQCPLQVQAADGDQWLDLTMTALADGAAPALLLHVGDATETVRTRQSLTILSENTLDLVVLLDRSHRVTWASPSILTVLGHDPQALVGMDLAELAAEDDLSSLAEALSGTAGVRTVRFRSTSGAYRYMSVTARPVDTSGPEPLTAAALRDITEELRAKRELARSEEYFRMAMLSAPEGMAVTDSQDRIVQVNPALCELLDVSADRLIGHRFREFIPTADREQVDQWRARLLHGNAGIERCQHRLASPTTEVWVDHSVGMRSDDSGSPQLYVHQFADRTAARRLEADLTYRASHDVATGLANRESLRTRLGQRLGHPPESTDYVGVLYCDIDDLKPTNDRYGHLVGDAVIAAVAGRLERAVRRQDVVARVGGDEFVIVLEHCASVDELEVVARNVHAAASHPVETSAGSVEISITVGAVLAESTAGTDEALARADAALYRAKRAGRNRISVEGQPD